MTEDIMDKLRRWNGQDKPAPVLPVGEVLHWVIARDNAFVNEIVRLPSP